MHNSMMLSRRQLLGSTVAAAGAFAANRAFGQTKRIVIDAQVHSWQPETADFKYVPGFPPHLPEPLTYDKLSGWMDGAGVDRAIIVPPQWVGERNDYALEAAKRFPRRFGVMGRFNVRDPKAAALLPTWTQQPNMFGVRLTFFGPAAAWLKDGSVDWFWPEADKVGLNVMFIAPGQTADFGKLAERYPRINFIVDHMGIITQSVKEGRAAEYIGHTLSLAKYPNVSVKVSGLANNATLPYPFNDINPHVQRVVEAFGAQRCYWGSDITVAFSNATYKERVRHLQEVSFLSESDKDWIMGKAIMQKFKWA
jgi:predicted TIM-barrel fold metal-dependent hydrolase